MRMIPTSLIPMNFFDLQIYKKKFIVTLVNQLIVKNFRLENLILDIIT